MNKSIYILLALLPLIIISCTEELRENSNGARKLVVDIAILKHESVENRITLPATVLPFEQVTLYAEVAGRIHQIYFQEGEHVKAGAPLIKIDSELLEARKAQKEIDLKFAKKEETRTKSLLDAEAGSLDAYELAQSKVASFEAALKFIKVEIDKTTLRAPFSGQVGLRMVSPGAFIGTSEPIAKIAQQDPLKVDFSVAQRFASQVKIGQTVQVNDKNGRLLGMAEVYAFDPLIESNTRSLKIRARIGKNENIFPGSFVQVDYNLGEIEKGIMVPSSAVSPVLNGQQIWLIKNGKAHPEIVELGIRTSDQVQIIGSISSGDTLVTTGLLSMRKGLDLKGKIKTRE